MEGYYSMEYPDNNPNNGKQVFNPLTITTSTPTTRIENITDSSWPPKVGALYNGKGPIEKEGEKYGYYETGHSQEYGGNMSSHRYFREVTKPLSKEEQEQAQVRIKAEKETRAKAKTIYDSNGPIGAPKVLAAVHIAHPRQYARNKQPVIPVGRFVLAFYTLQLRTDEEWYYTKLFNRVTNADDIAGRFKTEYDNHDEFLANYDHTTYEFEPDTFLQRLNQQSRVVAWPGNEGEYKHVGTAVALIGFDCDNLNIATKTGWDGIVPVRLLNPRVIHVGESQLEYVLELMHEYGEERRVKQATNESLFNGFPSIGKTRQSMDHLKASKVELKKLETDADRKNADNTVTTTTKEQDEIISKLTAEIEVKKQKLEESKTRINERDRITREGLNPNKNFLMKTRLASTKQNEAESFMSTQDYENSNKNVEELTTQINTLNDGIESSKKKRAEALNEWRSNPLVKKYNSLIMEIQELTKNANTGPNVTIYYDYRGFSQNPQPEFLMDTDFTAGNLIRLVGEKFGIIEPSTGGKRKSRKSMKAKRTMKSKRTMKAKRSMKAVRKHTKKYHSRSYRK